MGRYVREMELQLPREEVEQEVQEFLARMDFYPAFWKGKACFAADFYGANDTFLKNLKEYYFFDYTYENGILHLEAWARDGKKKETGRLNNAATSLYKPYLGSLFDLETRLYNKLPKDSELYQKGQQSFQAHLKKTNKSATKEGILLAVCLLVLMLMKFFLT